MWRKSLILTGFCGLLVVANGCAVTTGCGGCGEDGCGEVCGADFAYGGAIPPVDGHLPGCGCDEEVVVGCAAPAQDLVLPDVTCAAPGGCATCPTCAVPVYGTPVPAPVASAPPAHGGAPAPVPAPAMAPQNVYPPPLQGTAVQPYTSNMPLGVPAPAAAGGAAAGAAAGREAATDPAPSAPMGEPAGGMTDPAPQPNNGSDFDPDFGRYYQPRSIRPVNAVPMGNGYYIQQQGAQIPMQRVQQVPVQRVQQMSGDDLPTFYLD